MIQSTKKRSAAAAAAAAVAAVAAAEANTNQTQKVLFFPVVFPFASCLLCRLIV